jgi:nitric oxide reductase subunit B
MKYETQKLALLYFWGALILFLAQVTFGVLAGSIYVFPNLLSETLPFNILRMIHTNALIVWLLLGFFGATYYLIPEEAERDIESPFIAKLQFWIFFIAAAVAVVGYLFRIHEGREFLEQPIYVKIAIVVAALLFLYNVSLTVLRGRKTVISTILLIGLWGIAVFFLFAFYNPGNLSVDKLYWWWVVHLWVEGVWELVMASILAFLMIKLTGVDREVIEKWLYVIVGLSLFSGLLGTGHHYLWIGTPAYWHWVGDVFSTLEILPFFAMVLFTFYMVYIGGRDHPNKAALLWSLGAAVMSFFGAGVWGPNLRGVRPYNQLLNMWSFWMMTSAMAFMTFTLTFAGVVQSHLQRVLGMAYMDIQDQLLFFFWLRLGAGVVVVLAAFLFVYSILSPARERAPTRIAPQPAE